MDRTILPTHDNKNIEGKETNTHATSGIRTHALSAREFRTLFKQGSYTALLANV